MTKDSATLVFRCLLVLWATCGTQAQAAAKHHWKRYTNVRFAFSLCYPSDLLIGQGEPDNSDGQKFLSKDGSAEVRAFGRYDIDEDEPKQQALKDDYLSRIKWAGEDGFKITYQVLKRDRYVRSVEWAMAGSIT